MPKARCFPDMNTGVFALGTSQLYLILQSSSRRLLRAVPIFPYVRPCRLSTLPRRPFILVDGSIGLRVLLEEQL
jgi:hypothetical protein